MLAVSSSAMRLRFTSTSLKSQVKLSILSCSFQDDLDQYVDNGLGWHPHVPTSPWFHPNLENLLPLLRFNLANDPSIRLLLFLIKSKISLIKEMLHPSKTDI